MTTYPKIAWTFSDTPSGPEKYQKLLKAGVKDLVVPISATKGRLLAGSHHASLIRKAGLRLHPCIQTDLSSPIFDTKYFLEACFELHLKRTMKLTVKLVSNKEVKDKARRINQLVNYLAGIVPEENIGIAIDKKDLDSGEFKIEDLPPTLNVTSFNENKLNSGIEKAGTWIYTNTFEKEHLALGYDFYGFYTGEQEYQLSLESKYISQPGDTWVTIATRHGIWLPKLLQINNATYSTLIVPGQEIKLS
ncbi:LysM peptidoglycan-binding domain-containing protein (plasmid) [Lactobacillus sp. PV037]|uniref:LysM peptidoglycan-binding domain-containing protein n=1 Tax=unclassified Lactobacillus TaxID=2620435 RepID=UPI00223F75FC|nr:MULTISPECIES: LysM domain-containing protein [unclassified Lactobacillus]QNQ82908.1 LysM peptidoglycan-binding domain-containing protein [Lactobacillus sp. PV012]QNQ83013.1 LysM peptidoglycan-binding domain-containing protein [Lactobacillus sp. PV037]